MVACIPSSLDNSGDTLKKESPIHGQTLRSTMKYLPRLLASLTLATLSPVALGLEMVWELLPGRAKDIAVGGDGSVWIVGNGFGNRDVFRWNGSTWIEVGGSGVLIAAGPQGDPWLVNDDSDLFHRVNNQWVLITQTGSVSGVGVGADGTVLVTGGHSCYCGPVSNQKLYRYTPAAGFVLLPGNGEAAVIEPDGAGWWALNSNGEIFRWLGGPEYVRVEGHARDISRSVNGEIWIIGGGAFEAGDDRIFRWNGAQFELATTGQARYISVAPDGTPWVVNDGGRIFRGHRLLLSAGDVTVTEGAELRFPITLSYPSDRLTSVAYQLFRPDNTLAAGGTLSFSPGSTKQNVTLATPTDSVATGTRVYRLHLANAVGADVERPIASGTVLDDDVQAPVLTPFRTPGGGFAVRCASQSGFQYQLQRRPENLANATWTPVTTLAGTGNPIELGDTAPPANRAFYRVQISPAAP